MDKTTSRKKSRAAAVAVTVISVLVCAMAYLAYADGDLMNTRGSGHVEAGIAMDDGTLERSVLPGMSAVNAPVITVDTDTDAFVFAIVKDRINSFGTEYVSYDMAPGWTELSKDGLVPMSIDKILDVFDEHKTAGTIVADPEDPDTRIFFKVVHGNASSHMFGPYSIVKDDVFSYSGGLTNADMQTLSTYTQDQKELCFQTYAVQMDPFCDPTETDPVRIAEGAKSAWNQSVPVVPVTGVTVTPETLTMKVGKTSDPLTATVAPEDATNKDVTWSSSDETVAAVDENGVVTAVAVGTAIITATTEDGGYTDTCVVTVENTYGYAVQLHAYEDGKAVFWPAMGVNVVNEGRTCGSEHCIHNDSWEEIKANPDDYAQCIAYGCTKKLVIDETVFNSTELGAPVLTSGDGGGALFDGLTRDEAKWDYNNTTTPSKPTPTYPETLEKIKENSVLGSLNADIYLLSKAEIDAVKTTNASRIIYSNNGRTIQWYTSTVYPTTNRGTGRAWTVRGSFPDPAGTTPGAWYVVNIGDSMVTYPFGIAPAFSY